MCSNSLITASSNQPSMQVPNPRSAACRQKWAAAIPMSMSGKSRSLSRPPIWVITFGFSTTSTASTGACGANRLKLTSRLKVARATRSLSAGSVTRIRRQGWELLAEGDSRTASTRRSSVSSGTGRLAYFLTLCLTVIS